MTDAPRYTTLRDYLSVLRANRILILVAVVLFGVGAWALTAGEKSQYQAQSSLSFQDVDVQTGNLIGVGVSPSTDATQRAQINAATITRPAIVDEVAKQLHLSRPVPALVHGVSAAEQQATGFLVVTVQEADPGIAQRLANAYAHAVQIEETDLARSQFSAAAATVRQILRRPSIARNPVSSTNFGERLADLEFQAQNAAPVQIATNAAVPTAPVSPHPVRDAVLGIVLGLFLGIVIAFGRDALDRRLRGSGQITRDLGWPILGHIKEETLGGAGFVAGNGRDKLRDADLEGFRILRQNIQFLNVDNPPRSIVVTSAKPEEGKSTVAASLACASALTGRRTLLIDCDLRRPTLAKRLGVDGEPGLTDYLLGEAEPAQILRTVPLGAAPSSNGKAAGAPAGSTPTHVAGAQLVFIPAGKPTAYPSELLSSQRLRAFLAEVSAAYELVILDASPVLPVADTLELLTETQGVLLCVRASKTTSNELRAVKEAIERMPSRPAGVVITGVRSGSESDFGYYSHQYQYH